MIRGMGYKFIRAVKFFNRSIYSKIVGNSLQKVGKQFVVFPDAWIKGGEYIVIGDNFHSRSNLRLEALDQYNNKSFSPKISIGNNVSLGENCHIGAIDEVRIGDNVLFGSKIFISDHQHGQTTLEDMRNAPDKRTLYSKGKVIIEDNVWIGDNVVVMPGVNVGHNSILAANAVVTQDVLPYSVVAGVPAKIIKKVNG